MATPKYKKVPPKAATGLTIDRDGSNVIFSWKHADKYVSKTEVMWWFFKKESRTNASAFNEGYRLVSKNTTKIKATIPNNTCYGVRVEVIDYVKRLDEDDDERTYLSPLAYKVFEFYAPYKPIVTATWDSATPDKTLFEYTYTDKKHRPFKNVEYRTKWVTDYNGDPKSYSWTGTPSTSSSMTGTIFNSVETGISTGSHTRIVQCRACGQAGESGWVFKQHTYAQPNVPVITYASAKQDLVKGTTALDLAWTVQRDSAHPIDVTTVQYVITPPGAGMSVPVGANFQDADTPVGTSVNEWAEEIAGTLSDDDVLFARIKVQHDTRDNTSDAVIALKGNLAIPTGVSLGTPDQGTNTIPVNATNASTVPDSYLAITYRKGGTEAVMGIIPHGSTSVSMKVPPWTDNIGDVGVYAVVGSYTAQTADADGVVVYTITPDMTSSTVWESILPAPTITVSQAEIDNTATVSWNWVDPNATGAEVSWADHADAWESTDEPDTYIVNTNRASKLNVNGLEAGILWYFRVRLITVTGSETSYGLYSDIMSINLSSAPSIPALEMSEQVIDLDGQSIASWVYISNDNTLQAHATIADVDTSTNPWTYTPILQVGSDQNAVISPTELGWSIGDYLLAVQVESESGRFSEWSDTVPVTVADTLACNVTQTSLTSKTLTIDGSSVVYQYALDEMPMTVTVTGAGDTGQTVLTIKRADDFAIATPDEGQLNGYAGEVVCQYTYTGETQQTINIDDVHGKLNDTATYYIEATVTDNLGRTASARYPDDDPDDFFTVLWNDQAIMPDGEAAIVDNDYALLTINKPVGAQAGDSVDIYRLTADKPQLILNDVEMDSVPVYYVDPYPALGVQGYRFVYKTVNGDTTTVDDDFAWLDIETLMPSDHAILDFDGQRVDLGHNLKHSNTFGKQFQETRYLGGSIEGDWTAGVSRSGSIDAVVVMDADKLKALRRLANHIGICHIRTCDGSVITANVDLGDDMGYDKAGKIENVKLSFTRVDPVELDGMTLEEWEGES